MSDFTIEDLYSRQSSFNTSIRLAKNANKPIKDLRYQLNSRYANAISKRRNNGNSHGRTQNLLQPSIRTIRDYDFSRDHAILAGVKKLQEQIVLERAGAAAASSSQSSCTPKSGLQSSPPAPSSSILLPEKLDLSGAKPENFVNLDPSSILLSPSKQTQSGNLTEFLSEFSSSEDPFNNCNMAALNDMKELADIFKTIPVGPSHHSNSPDTCPDDEPLNQNNDQNQDEDTTNPTTTTTTTSEILALAQAASDQDNSESQKEAPPTPTLLNRRIENTLSSLPNFSSLPQTQPRRPDHHVLSSGDASMPIPQRTSSLRLSGNSSVKSSRHSSSDNLSEGPAATSAATATGKFLDDFSGKEKEIAANLVGMGYGQEVIRAGILVAGILIEFKNEKNDSENKQRQQELQRFLAEEKRRKKKGALAKFFGSGRDKSSSSASAPSTAVSGAQNAKIVVSDFYVIEIIDYLNLLTSEPYGLSLDNGLGLFISLNVGNKVKILALQSEVEKMGFPLEKSQILGGIEAELRSQDQSLGLKNLLERDNLSKLNSVDPAKVLQLIVEGNLGS